VLVLILAALLHFLCVILRVLRFILSVHHDLAAHPVMDVAMVFSPRVGIGYHSTSMVDNQTHTKVISSALRTLWQPTNQPLNFLSWALEFSLWATKQNAQVGFWLVWCDQGQLAPAPRETKKCLRAINRTLRCMV
jgi:hypothetical protein